MEKEHEILSIPENANQLIKRPRGRNRWLILTSLVLAAAGIGLGTPTAGFSQLPPAIVEKIVCPENTPKDTLCDYRVQGTAQDEIQTAIDSLPQPGGGRVLLKSGFYPIDRRVTAKADHQAIVLRNNVWLRGEGQNADGTVLRLIDGAIREGKDAVVIIDTYDETANTPSSNTRVSNLQIDGNKENQNPTTTNALQMSLGIWIRQVTAAPRHKGNTIDDVTVNNTISGGIYLEEVSANRLLKQNTRISNAVVYGNGTEASKRGGIHFDSMSYAFLENVTAFDNYAAGLYVYGSTHIQGTNIQTHGNIRGLYVSGQTGYETFGNDFDISSTKDGYGVMLSGLPGLDIVYDTKIQAKVTNSTYPGIWVRYVRGLDLSGTVGNVPDDCISIRDTKQSRFNLKVSDCGATGLNLGLNVDDNLIQGEYTGNQWWGIYMNGDSNTISAKVGDNSQLAHNAYSEIRVDGSHNQIVNSTILSTLAKRAKYSVEETSGDYNLICGSTLEGAATGPVSLVGPHSKVEPLCGTQ